jgi:hypothetical protein
MFRQCHSMSFVFHFLVYRNQRDFSSAVDTASNTGMYGL